MSEINSNVYVALGSNLGSPQQELRKAFSFLETLSLMPLQKSSLWVSSPVDCAAESGDFFNAVAGLTLEEGSSAETFLNILQAYEEKSGRPLEHGYHTPRTIDLDILYFQARQIKSERLKVPHPLALERRFVVEPWAEIAPELRIGEEKSFLKEIAERLRVLYPEQKLSRLGSA